MTLAFGHWGQREAEGPRWRQLCACHCALGTAVMIGVCSLVQLLALRPTTAAERVAHHVAKQELSELMLSTSASAPQSPVEELSGMKFSALKRLAGKSTSHAAQLLS